jgi:hypothetical protein
MKQSSRILLLGLFVFVVLSGIGLYLMSTIAVGNDVAARRIAEVWGGAMGILVPLIGIGWWVVRRKNR